MKTELFYHFTEQKDAKDIFADGILPKAGERAVSTGQKKPYVYLCREEDLTGWFLELPLKNPYLMELRLPETFVQEHIEKTYSYGMQQVHAEYVCDAKIPAKYIKPTSLPKIPEESYTGIVKDILLSLSKNIVHVVHACDLYESKTQNISKEKMKEDMEKYAEYESRHLVWYVGNLQKLGILDKANTEELVSMLKKEGGSGEYTLCDTYDNKLIQMWEQVGQFEGCPLPETRKSLSECIRKYFPWVSEVNTGGYTNPYK